MSESKIELYKAIAAFQAEMPFPEKASENPFHKSRYADLATTLRTVLPVMQKHGLMYFQCPSFADGMLTVQTTLAHVAGESIVCNTSIPLTPKGPQDLGSAITYLRRYALSAILGIASEDDDGEAAQSPSRSNGHDRQQQQQQPQARQQVPQTKPQEREPMGTKDERMALFSEIKKQRESQSMETLALGEFAKKLIGTNDIVNASLPQLQKLAIALAANKQGFVP